MENEDALSIQHHKPELARQTPYDSGADIGRRADSPDLNARPTLRLCSLGKKYHGLSKPAVDDLSIEIAEGETFALLGPSGSGKTTTLRMIAGLETPSDGEIHMNGQPIVVMKKGFCVPPEKRQLGMVFQSYAIWPHMTVAENIGYPLKIRRASRKEIEMRVEKVLELVGLEGLSKRPATHLSGGQQQRVALARALVYEPCLLLLDEPFSNLDTKLRDQMRLEIRLLKQKLKTTILLVTHDQLEALSLADRIAVMADGKLQQVGTPASLYSDPANAFVRDFLGRTVSLIGIFEGIDTNGRGKVRFLGEDACVITGAILGAAQPKIGDEILISNRPEDINVSVFTPGKNSSGNLIGVIEAALFMGERYDLHIRFPGQKAVTLHGDRSGGFTEGDKVSVAFSTGNAGIWPVHSK